MCPNGSQVRIGNNQIKNDRASRASTVSCGPGRRKKGKQAQGATASASEKLRPCCPRGNGALSSHRETWEMGENNEIIKQDQVE